MKILRSLFVMLGLVLFVGSITMISCDDASTVGEAEEGIENAGEEMSAEFREEREELREDLQEIRNDINEKTEELREEMAEANAEAKAEIQEQLNKLEAWGQKIDRRMADLGQDIKDGWNEFKNDTRTVMTEIRNEWNDWDND